MKDDYLWDGTGEVDPDVERLEGLLGRYRSTAPPPELPAAPVVPIAEVRRARAARLLAARPLAAAAAVLFVAGAALAVWLVASDSRQPTQVANGNTEVLLPGPVPPPADGGGPDVTRPGGEPGVAPEDGGPQIARADGGSPRRPRRATRRDPAAAGTPNATDRTAADPTVPSVAAADPTAPDAATAAARPARRPDFVTVRHLEEAEMLLRSVRNSDYREGDEVDLAYDAHRARELLDRNVVLRRAAEARGNVPVEQLLGDVEPYLLDIANLGERPSPTEVRSIQARIERREIVSDLRLYAMRSPARGL